MIRSLLLSIPIKLSLKITNVSISMATTNEQLETSEFAGTDIDSSIPFRLIRIVNLMARSFPSDHTTKYNVTLIESR